MGIQLQLNRGYFRREPVDWLNMMLTQNKEATLVYMTFLHCFYREKSHKFYNESHPTVESLNVFPSFSVLFSQYLRFSCRIYYNTKKRQMCLMCFCQLPFRTEASVQQNILNGLIFNSSFLAEKLQLPLFCTIQLLSGFKKVKLFSGKYPAPFPLLF